MLKACPLLRKRRGIGDQRNVWDTYIDEQELEVFTFQEIISGEKNLTMSLMRRNCHTLYKFFTCIFRTVFAEMLRSLKLFIRYTRLFL